MSSAADRARLVHAAQRYVAAGWPILPLTPAGEQVVCGISPPDAATVDHWWGDRAYGLGCRTGVVFDALTIPAWVGPATLRKLPGPTPAIDVGTGQWLCLVKPSAPMIPELRIAARVHRSPRWQPRLYGTGDWIRLPPTTDPLGQVSWITETITETDELPHSLVAQWALVRTLNTLRRRRAAQIDEEREDCERPAAAGGYVRLVAG